MPTKRGPIETAPPASESKRNAPASAWARRSASWTCADEAGGTPGPLLLHRSSLHGQPAHFLSLTRRCPWVWVFRGLNLVRFHVLFPSSLGRHTQGFQLKPQARFWATRAKASVLTWTGTPPAAGYGGRARMAWPQRRRRSLACPAPAASPRERSGRSPGGGRRRPARTPNISEIRSRGPAACACWGRPP